MTSLNSNESTNMSSFIQSVILYICDVIDPVTANPDQVGGIDFLRVDAQDLPAHIFVIGSMKMLADSLRYIISKV